MTINNLLSIDNENVSFSGQVKDKSNVFTQVNNELLRNYLHIRSNGYELKNGGKTFTMERAPLNIDGSPSRKNKQNWV